jgi:hypothetical protein
VLEVSDVFIDEAVSLELSLFVNFINVTPPFLILVYNHVLMVALFQGMFCAFLQRLAMNFKLLQICELVQVHRYHLYF